VQNVLSESVLGCAKLTMLLKKRQHLTFTKLVIPKIMKHQSKRVWKDFVLYSRSFVITGFFYCKINHRGI
jgi:hypothetical protein